VLFVFAIGSPVTLFWTQEFSERWRAGYYFYRAIVHQMGFGFIYLLETHDLCWKIRIYKPLPSDEHMWRRFRIKIRLGAEPIVLSYLNQEARASACFWSGEVRTWQHLRICQLLDVLTKARLFPFDYRSKLMLFFKGPGYTKACNVYWLLAWR
jgi:hypothetical protein